jgi:hypothetical protein
VKLFNYFLSRVVEKYSKQIQTRQDKRIQELKTNLQILLRMSGMATFKDEEINAYFKELLIENKINPATISPEGIKQLTKKFQAFICCKLAARLNDLAITDELSKAVDDIITEQTINKKYTLEQKQGLEQAR